MSNQALDTATTGDEVAAGPRPSRRARRRHVMESRWILWVSTPMLLALFLVVWRLYVVVLEVGPLLLPPPEDVFSAIIFLVQQPYVHQHAYATLYATLVGFSLAAVVGIMLGVLLGKVRFLERLLSPFLVATQVVPKVAIVPLFILWFGFGVTSKVFMAALLAFFPVMQNTILGVRSIERGHRDLMTVVQASRWKRIVSLDIPSSLPYVLTGVELGMVFAITGAVVGEYLGGNEGLGAFVVITLNALRTDQLFATVLILTFLGFMLYAIVAAIRRYAIPWHESSGRIRDV